MPDHDPGGVTPVWVRNGLLGGVAAFATTLGANLLILAMSPAAVCRIGPAILPLSGLAGFLFFILIATGAGFATGHAIGAVSHAALAGLVVGALGGCALLALVPLDSAVRQRIQQLSSQCPTLTTRSFSFQLGPRASSGGGLSSPPPGVVIGSPPPAAAPPAGTVTVAVSGTALIVVRVIGLIVALILGLGLAAGAASIGGVLGAQLRRPAG